MRFFTTLYVLLLAYIIAALIFWGFSLEKQNHVIYLQERLNVSDEVDSVKSPVAYQRRVADLSEQQKSRSGQYLAEGATFLIVILLGAAVVYSSFQANIRLSRQQNNFMLAVTHELKSPVAGIKLSLQTIEKRPITEDQRNLLIARCIQESDRLNDLCNNMLITSQMDGRQYVPAHERVQLSDLVSQSLTTYNYRHPGRFSSSVAEHIMVNGDVVLLQMALHNLMENAVKYTPPRSRIHISLKQEADQVKMCVADNGQGIPETEKKKIFSKFYRVGDEATRKTKGTGLGLYLTAKIVAQHKGKINVTDNQPSGVIFEICLPAIKDI